MSCKLLLSVVVVMLVAASVAEGAQQRRNKPEEMGGRQQGMAGRLQGVGRSSEEESNERQMGDKIRMRLAELMGDSSEENSSEENSKDSSEENSSEENSKDSSEEESRERQMGERMRMRMAGLMARKENMEGMDGEQMDQRMEKPEVASSKKAKQGKSAAYPDDSSEEKEEKERQMGERMRMRLAKLMKNKDNNMEGKEMPAAIMEKKNQIKEFMNRVALACETSVDYGDFAFLCEFIADRKAHESTTTVSPPLPNQSTPFSP